MNSIDIDRNNRLLAISQLVIDNKIVHKLDLIANIFIGDVHYFTVFRRYNSVYDIVIEDMNQELYFHKDYTIRESLKNVLCLTDEVTRNIYTNNAYSYKHNSAAPQPIPPYNVADIIDMRWSDIQRYYHGLNINVNGIVFSWAATPAGTTSVNGYIGVSGPDYFRGPTGMTGPAAPIIKYENYSYKKESNCTNSVVGQKRERELVIDIDDNDNNENNNYIILRNGTKIPKN
jgi:hypothetical protein